MLSGQLNKHNFQIVFKVQAGAHKALNPDRLRRLLRERVGQKKGRLTSGQIARETHTPTQRGTHLNFNLRNPQPSEGLRPKDLGTFGCKIYLAPKGGKV